VARARDTQTAVRRITHLAVPRFAVAAAVYTADVDGTIAPLVASRPKDVLPSEDETTAAALAAESGQATMTPRLIVVPLTHGRQTLGVMAFVARAEQLYRDEDLVFARDLAHHAASIVARGVTVA
jgi:hypothetical protein